MKKIYIKRLLVLCFILLILILMACICINLAKTDEEDFEEYKAKVYKKMMEVEVMPNGMFELKQNYKGDHDLQEFYESLRSFSNEIIVLSKKDEKNLEKYYEENKEEIKKSTGITEFEKFKELKEYIRQQGEVKSLVTANINTTSFEDTGKYLQFNIDFNYEDGKKFSFKVHLMNNQAYKRFVRYEILK